MSFCLIAHPSTLNIKVRREQETDTGSMVSVVKLHIKIELCKKKTRKKCCKTRKINCVRTQLLMLYPFGLSRRNKA